MKFGILLFAMMTFTMQCQERKGFFQLPGPKKTWVLFDPFKAEITNV
ncbi:MAG: hypothetical protein ACPH5K_03690 [Polaribacter sp.]